MDGRPNRRNKLRFQTSPALSKAELFIFEGEQLASLLTNFHSSSACG